MAAAAGVVVAPPKVKDEIQEIADEIQARVPFTTKALEFRKGLLAHITLRISEIKDDAHRVVLGMRVLEIARRFRAGHCEWLSNSCGATAKVLADHIAIQLCNERPLSFRDKAMHVPEFDEWFVHKVFTCISDPENRKRYEHYAAQFAF